MTWKLKQHTNSKVTDHDFFVLADKQNNIEYWQTEFLATFGIVSQLLLAHPLYFFQAEKH